MRQAIWLSLALIALFGIAVQAVHAASLTTLFSHTNGDDGNMFDVEVVGSPLKVTSLDLNLHEGTYDLELYSKSGTYVGFDQTPGAWTLIDSVNNVLSNGADVPTPVDFLDFVLAANSTSAIYVTATVEGMLYTRGTSVGNLASSNSDLRILEGAGKAYVFDTAWEPRIWNGTIHYNVIPEPATALLVAAGLAGLAAAGRRRSLH